MTTNYSSADLNREDKRYLLKPKESKKHSLVKTHDNMMQT